MLPDAAGDGPAGDDRLGVSRAATIRGRSSSREFLDDIRLERDAVPRGSPTRAPRSTSSRRSTDVGYDPARATMIITRSPLRITLGGGGTDLPSYYREHGGFLIAAAIDKYVYITVMRPFVAGHLSSSTRSSSTSSRSTTSSIRSSARRCGCSSFGRRRSRSPRWPTSRPAPARLVRQLHDRAAQGALRAPAPTAASAASWPSRPARSRSTGSASRSASRTSTSRRTAASPASRSIRDDTRRGASRCRCSIETLYNLEDNLLLFFTGFSRSAGAILKDQNERSRAATTQR